jgi:hypothetical protein
MSFALISRGIRTSGDWIGKVVLKNQQAKLHDSLAFVSPYGQAPAQRAFNGYLRLYESKALENTILAGISAVKSGQMQLKQKDLAGTFSTFDSTSKRKSISNAKNTKFVTRADLESLYAVGHTYHLTVNLPLNPGIAKQLIDDPRALIHLMASFPTGATFVKQSTISDLLGLTSDQRITYEFNNLTRIRKEHKEALESKSFLTEYGAVLGGVDIILLRGHGVSTHVGGVKEQSWEAGTSGAHGLCGKLTWRIIWDPNNPNNLIIQWYGEGQSYSSLVDDSNSIFTSFAFPLIAELFQSRVNKGYLDKTDDEFDNFLKTNDPGLANRVWILKLLMPQRLAELLNEFWRQPDQFDAAKVEAILKAKSKALTVRLDSDVIEIVVDSKNSISELVEKTGSSDDSLQPGLYYNDKFVDGGAPQALFLPEEEIKQ